MTKDFTGRQRLKYVASDLIASNAAWCLFNVIRYYSLPVNYNEMSLQTYYSMPVVLVGQIVFPLMMLALFALSGFYQTCTEQSRVDQIVNTFGVSLAGSVAIFFIALFNDSIDDRLRNYEMFLILWLLIAISVSLPRMIIARRFARKVLSHEIQFNTMIVGTTERAVEFGRQLESRYPRMGLNVVGYVEESAGTAPISGKIDDKPVYSIDTAIETIDRLGVRSFIIIGDNADANDTLATINRLFPTGKSIYITPDAFHYITLRPRTRSVSGEVLIDISKSNIPQMTLNFKRVADIVISAVTLAVLAPAYIVIAAAVKLTSPGSVIYKQQRVGRKKKLFNIYKFRSMYTGSEASGPRLSSDNDKRITPLGHFMRKYRIDELPQFWNVLKGDMSLVGPRPEREYFINQIIRQMPFYSLLHQVRPGITSWGMVKYGYASSVSQMIERARYDLMYVDNISLTVDMKILLYTIETVITGKGV